MNTKQKSAPNDTTGGIREIAKLARRAALGREPWYETLIEIATLAELLAFSAEARNCSLAVNQQSVCARARGLDSEAEASDDAASK